MKKSTILFLFLKLYRLIWFLILPILKRDFRLQRGIKQRLSSDHFSRADVWIQAASAGESSLALYLAKNLQLKFCEKSNNSLKAILLTSTTSQGVELLSSGFSQSSNSHTQITWFPFDIPDLMLNVIHRVRPSVVVLIETELWPSLLFAAKQNGVKVVVINGRMSKKSHKHYMLTKWLWRKIEPDTILAISKIDTKRFKDVFPKSEVSLMPNMKFDTIIAANGLNLFDFPANLPFSILASIREEEEKDAIFIINQLLKKFPNQVIGLFPRHQHRLNFWKKALKDNNHKLILRSEIDNQNFLTHFLTYKDNKNIPFGSVILWDIFGELKNAYCFATVAFVGGSLKQLGGHNFIEPITSGAATVTGPFIDDFAWAGYEIFNNIVKKAKNRDEVVDFMVSNLKNPHNRKDIIRAAFEYIKQKQGGTLIACNKINLTTSKS
ncbi:MAG: 3-deoxy-D-manno-octulosonic acid transferase [Desulfamplus sp.]|nr:3-deoxy-D-manno-octulosonic acid transferase [Desulfamplus sp.]